MQTFKRSTQGTVKNRYEEGQDSVIIATKGEKVDLVSIGQ